MHIITSLAIMLLPFGAFLLVIGGRTLRSANKHTLSMANSNGMSLPVADFEEVHTATTAMRHSANPQGYHATAQFQATPQERLAIGDTFNVTLTQDQLEVIADALEFTGEYIEHELKDTAGNPEERRELVADLVEVNAALEVVASVMDTTAGTATQAN
jgi:hypothetical protein